MKQFKVFVSDQAWLDIDNLTNYIRYEKLGKYADSISKSHYKSVLIYGKNARSINYKKHAVIYTVRYKTVIIQRIIIASLIKE